MMSSNDLLLECSKHGRREVPGFALIVAFDFHDGLERGLALYPSGEGVKFSTLGDSKSRLFRAFELIPIKGVWWTAIEVLQNSVVSYSTYRLLWPAKSSEAAVNLERAVLGAPEQGLYIGVGSPYLEAVRVSFVTSQQLETVRQLGCSLAGFALAHRFVKATSHKI